MNTTVKFLCVVSMLFFFAGNSNASLIGATVHGWGGNFFNPGAGNFFDDTVVVNDSGTPEFTGSTAEVFTPFGIIFDYSIDIDSDSIWVDIFPQSTDYTTSVVDLMFDFIGWPSGNEQSIVSVQEVVADRIGVTENPPLAVTSFVDFNGVATLWMPGVIISPDVGQATYHFSITTEFVQNPIPEPTTMILFGTGIAGLAAVGRRKK